MTVIEPAPGSPTHRHAPTALPPGPEAPVAGAPGAGEDTPGDAGAVPSRNGTAGAPPRGNGAARPVSPMHAPPVATRPAPALRVRGLTVTLGHLTVLDGVDLDVPGRSWTAVVGPNGAGKSTLLRVLAGVLRGRGQVLLGGREVTRMVPRRRAALVGYAPQNPVLPEALTVREYVALGRTPYHGLLAGPDRSDEEVVEQSLVRLDLRGLAARSLRALSGGERQRVVLARTLAQRPEVLLLDEPTTALDLGHAQQVLELVDRLRREEGLTVVSTLHDLVLAGQYADRLVLLADGRVAAAGPPAQVLTARRLATHYGAHAEVVAGPGGVRVHPLRPR